MILRLEVGQGGMQGAWWGATEGGAEGGLQDVLVLTVSLGAVGCQPKGAGELLSLPTCPPTPLRVPVACAPPPPQRCGWASRPLLRRPLGIS